MQFACIAFVALLSGRASALPKTLLQTKSLRAHRQRDSPEAEVEAEVTATKGQIPAEDHGIQTGAAEFGPEGCFRTWKNSAGQCMIQTQCQGVDITAYPVEIVCEEAGDVVRHAFGADSFDKQETFNTLISCDKCSANKKPDVSVQGNVTEVLNELVKSVDSMKADAKILEGHIQKLEIGVLGAPNVTNAKTSATKAALLEVTARMESDTQVGADAVASAGPEAKVTQPAAQEERHTHRENVNKLYVDKLFEDSANARLNTALSDSRMQEPPPTASDKSPSEIKPKASEKKGASGKGDAASANAAAPSESATAASQEKTPAVQKTEEDKSASGTNEELAADKEKSSEEEAPAPDHAEEQASDNADASADASADAEEAAAENVGETQGGGEVEPFAENDYAAVNDAVKENMTTGDDFGPQGEPEEADAETEANADAKDYVDSDANADPDLSADAGTTAGSNAGPNAASQAKHDSEANADTDPSADDENTAGSNAETNAAPQDTADSEEKDETSTEAPEEETTEAENNANADKDSEAPSPVRLEDTIVSPDQWHP